MWGMRPRSGKVCRCYRADSVNCHVGCLREAGLTSAHGNLACPVKLYDYRYES